MKTARSCLVGILIGATLCYIYFMVPKASVPFMVSKASEPIEVFLNDPAAFSDFLLDDNTAEAIAASPTTRRILTENAKTADVLLRKNGSTDYVIEIKDQALANKAIAILRSNSAEFTKFFRDERVANKISETSRWMTLNLRLGIQDGNKELERMKYETEVLKMIKGIR